MRLAEAVLQIQPGYLPMRPNGDPMFRGSQFNSRINGGQTMATENFFDGAAFGYAVGHQQSQESTPPVEAVQEVKVISTSYSAQYGHTSGGFIEYTGKSGTNSYRGSVYDYVANDKFNSTGFFAKQAGTGPSPLSNNNYGATLRRSRAAAEYDGHNKTFFFVNYDYTRLRSGVLPGFGNTTPIDAFKNGDFSALLTGNQIATDALGRPIFAGPDLQPGHHPHLVNGIPVRDPYPGNVIPANDPMRSLVASRIVPLMVHPDRPGSPTTWPAIRPATRRGSSTRGTSSARVDHNFSKSFRGSTSFYWNHRPSDPQLRRGRRAAPCRTILKRAAEEHRLLRRRVLPADLHAAPAPAVRLDHQRQPAQPLRRSPTTAGSWAGTTSRPARSGRSGCGPARPPRRAASSTRPRGPPRI